MRFFSKTPEQSTTDHFGSNGDYEKRIKQYLDSQHCVLWGQFYDIESKEGRRGAENFILDLLIDLGITREKVE